MSLWMPVRRWMSPWYCQASDVSPHVTCSACLRPVVTRQWPSQWCRVVFRSHYLAQPEKTRPDEFISILVTIMEEVSFIGSRYRVSAEIRISSAEIFFRCSRKKGISPHNFSNMSTIVSVLVRATMRQSATIFLNMHLLENASMGRIAEKLPSAVIIMEIILLWKCSFVRVSDIKCPKPNPNRAKKVAWAQSQSLFVKFSAACMQEMWWITSCC